MFVTEGCQAGNRRRARVGCERRVPRAARCAIRASTRRGPRRTYWAGGVSYDACDGVSAANALEGFG